MGTIVRKPTPEELNNYTPVGFETVEKRFKKKRVEAEQKYVKKHEPFCARCADLDFNDMWESKKKELERKLGRDVNETKLDFKFPDLSKYGDIDRFELKNKSPIIENVVMDGAKVPTLKGNHYNYVCKVRGCGIAVDVPKIDLTQETEEIKTPEKTKETSKK